MRCKRGQFYLITAIIIVGLLIGLAAVSNYAIKKSSVRVYTLRDELKIESEKVLDYGVYTGLEGKSFDSFVKSFTDLYADRNENLYFIFGDETGVTFIGYSDLEGVTINTGNGEQTFIADGNLHGYGITQDEVVVTIEGNPQIFEWKKGQNFYFIIHSTYEGEEYVITN